MNCAPIDCGTAGKPKLQRGNGILSGACEGQREVKAGGGVRKNSNVLSEWARFEDTKKPSGGLKFLKMVTQLKNREALVSVSVFLFVWFQKNCEGEDCHLVGNLW